MAVQDRQKVDSIVKQIQDTGNSKSDAQLDQSAREAHSYDPVASGLAGEGDARTAQQTADDAAAAAALAALRDLSNVIAGSVTQAMLASGLRAFVVTGSLPTLPDAAYPQGAVVFLTSDNKLYRSTGTAWTVATPAADISGQIATGQIADSAISLAKFASGVRPIQSGAALPTLPDATYPDGAFFYLTTDKKLYRSDGSVWTAQASQDYVVAKGMNLIVNGSGILGNNYNFSGFVFSGSEANGGPGSFYRESGSNSLYTDEYLPVDPAKYYEMRVSAKLGLGSPFFYAGGAFYDADKLQIQPFHHMFAASTHTTLAAPLNPGDTTIQLTSAANWQNAGQTYQRAIMFWGYTNSKGYTYPDYTYTRNTSNNDSTYAATTGTWAVGGISGNTITLARPWPAGLGSYPAGTKVSNNSSGGTFKYFCANHVALTTSWQDFKGTIGTMDLSGANVVNKFPPGVAYMKGLFLVNYDDGTTKRTYITNVWFSEAVGQNLSDGSVGSGPLASGAVTGTKIADGALTQAKFASGLRATEIVTVLPSPMPNASYPEGALVYLTTDDKLYRSTGSAWTAAVATGDLTGQITNTQITDGAISTPKLAANAVTANELAANAVIAGKIAAGAVAAGEIAADSISAKHLVVANTENVCPNPSFEEGTVKWTMSGTATVEATGGRLAISPKCLKLPGGGGLYAIRSTGDIPIQPGQTFYMECWAKASGVLSSGGFYARIRGKDAAGAEIWTPGVAQVVPTTSWAKTSFSATLPNSAPYNTVVTVNAEIVSDTPVGADIFIDDVYFRRAMDSSLIVDGAIVAAKIGALAVEAGKIAANAVTATEIAANAVVAGKIAANAVEAGDIAANAVTATTIAAGAVTAGKIAADAITANEIQAGAIGASELAADAVIAGKIAANAVEAGDIAANAVTATTIAAGAVVAGKIGANAVTATELAADAVTANKIQAGAVTAAKLAANVIQTADYAVDANKKPTAGAAMIAAVDATSWSSGTTYASNDVVIYSGVVYRSLQAANTNHTPNSSPTWWEVFPPLRVGPGGMLIGSFTMDELKGAALSAIARGAPPSTDIVWYRGNNSASVNSGAPVVNDPAWARDATYAVGDRVCGLPYGGFSYLPYNYGYSGNNVPMGVFECTQAGNSVTTAQATAAAWSAATTYSAGQVCTSSGMVYSSKAGGNLNHAPVAPWAGADAYWNYLGAVNGPGLYITTGNLTYSGKAYPADNTCQWKWVGPAAGAWCFGGGNSYGQNAWARSTAYSIGHLVRGDPVDGASYYTTWENAYPRGTMVPNGVSNENNYCRRLYRCVQAGTSSASGVGPTGTGTNITDGTAKWDYVREWTGPTNSRVQLACLTTRNWTGTMTEFVYELTITPRTAKDNLDALRYAEVWFYAPSAGGSVVQYENIDSNYAYAKGNHFKRVAISGRGYYDPVTHDTIENCSKATVHFFSEQWFATTPNAGTLFARVRLWNDIGYSDVDFGPAHLVGSLGAGGNTMPALLLPFITNLTPSPPPPGGGGGGGGGGGCLDPYTPVVVGPGKSVPLYTIGAGAYVWTRPEGGGDMGFHRVEKAVHTSNLRCRVTFTDGRDFTCSINHLLNVRGIWRRADSLTVGEEVAGEPNGYVAKVEYLGEGVVVQLSIPTAGTYYAGNGAWHHNTNKN